VKTTIVVPEEIGFQGQVKPWDDEADSGFPRNPQVIANQQEIPMSLGRRALLPLHIIIACAASMPGNRLATCNPGITDEKYGAIAELSTTAPS
jgi:hypothetical protein